MTVELKRVTIDEKEILANLLEKYDYEFSQWDERDVNKLGLYGYGYLDYYWTETRRYAYFIKVDGTLAGFAMVNNHPETEEVIDFNLAEFFIMYKYRRLGVGKTAAYRLFDMYKGRWQLKRHPRNIASVHFWNRVVDGYTNGEFSVIKNCENIKYADGSCADVFFFDNRNYK